MNKIIFKPLDEYQGVKIHASEYNGKIYFLQREIAECLGEFNTKYSCYKNSSIIGAYLNEQQAYAEFLPKRQKYIRHVCVWSSEILNEMFADYKNLFKRRQNSKLYRKGKVERVMNFINYFQGVLMNKANALFNPKLADLRALSLKELCELRQKILAE